MKHVLLSADGPVCICAVPDKVAEDLPEWADRFRSWMETAPEAARFRHVFPGGEVGLAFNEQDFIVWLAEVAFPEQPASVVEELGFMNPRSAAEPVRSMEWYNF